MTLAQHFIFWLDRHTNILQQVELRRAKWFMKRFGGNIHLSHMDAMLDIGCGVGDITRCLAMRTSGLVLGCDLEDYRRRGVKSERRFEFILADPRCLPLPDRCFDHVTIFWALHHSAEPELIVKEAIRVLKYGGGLYVFEDVVDVNNRFERTMTRVYDMVINLEWNRHPEGNKSLHEWDRLISESGSVERIHQGEEPMWRLSPGLRFGMLIYKKTK